MKKLLFTLATSLFVGLNSYGQAPEGFKYQAVVRDAGSVVLNNQAVGIQLTILQGSITGTAVYTETFATTSNAYGLVNLEIGTGTTTDDFSLIDWSNDTYFIETSMDATGGTNYSVMGTSQLMSVPYALHSKTAENVINDAVDDADNDPTNEHNTAVVLNGTSLETTDGGGTIATDLSSLVDDADADATNEIQNLSQVLTVGDDANGNNIVNVDSLAIGSVTPTEKLDVTGKVKSSEGYYTISGTINIPGPGVYQIVYGNGYRGIGTMSCSIDQVPNGIWNAGGTVAFSENNNTQDYLLNVVEYQLYSGGNINAELRPLNNVNYDNVGANIDGRVEVDVVSISQPSVLRWSLTVFPAN